MSNPDLGKLPVEIIPAFCYDDSEGFTVDDAGGVLLVNRILDRQPLQLVYRVIVQEGGNEPMLLRWSLIPLCGCEHW